MKSINEIRNSDGGSWLNNAKIWLYRGAWQEWEIEKIDMAVPLTTEEADKKRHAIWQSESQKDPAPFYGSDPREFWQRIDARNRDTAGLFNRLGIVSVHGLEVFVNWDTIKHNINF